jgi:hypothetical protein
VPNQRMKPIPGGQACGFAALRGLSAAPLCKWSKPSELKMIFGEIVHEEHSYEVFPGLLELVKSEFNEVQSGVQGDAWIWIIENDEKVAIDSFTSMRFQIKCGKVGGILLGSVISVLERKYTLYLYQNPEIEGHEDLN